MTASRRIMRTGICLSLILLSIGVTFWLFPLFEQTLAHTEHQFLLWLRPLLSANGFLLLPFIGFAGGLLASISPCILSLLPLNLSYIGTLEVHSKVTALKNAAAFVLGVIVVLCLLGLVSSLAVAFTIQYKGFSYLGVGLLSLIMGLFAWRVLPFPQWQAFQTAKSAWTPFGVGIAFALSTSPCASPVLMTVLGAASSTGKTTLAFLTMAAYAIGYTLILFLASLFTGLAKQVMALRRFESEISLMSGLLLMALGLFYIGSAIAWFWG